MRETRSLVVNLPPDNEETEAVIVVEFSEANGFAPAPFSVRLPVRAAAKGVALELTCRVRSAGEGLVTVDAGQSLTIDCQIGNRGVPARGVVVTLGVAGQRDPRKSAPIELGTDRQQTLTFAVEVPRSAKLDERIALHARARAEGTSATAEARLEVVIARPQICPDGRLDRAAYRAKRAELRKAHADGLLSKEELERYEALLVGCLQ
jgi:hypothetical protein